MRLGAPVTIISLANPARESHGTVREIAGMAVNRSGETIVPVQISIDHDQGFLLPNFNVDVAIEYIELAPDCPPLGSGAPRCYSVPCRHATSTGSIRRMRTSATPAKPAATKRMNGRASPRSRRRRKR